MSDISMPPEAVAMPDPGDKLIGRVAGGTERASFFWSGRESVRALERTLAIVGRSLDSFESVLDFGCGCGRMLLWLEDLGRKRALHGTDVDAEAVEWCRRHIPYAEVTVNEPDPPLPYPDAAFDLIYNHSVFTHLDETRQDLWLSELKRVVRPGGMIVLSTHGEAAIPENEWAIRDRLERDGIAFLDNTVPSKLGHPDWYQATWHAPWYVFEHWSRWFEVRAYIPGGALRLQDHILLERRWDHESPRMPLAARPRDVPEGRPAQRVKQALAEVRANRNGSGGATTGPRSLRGLMRGALLRALRPYSFHEDNFDRAVAASIEDLTQSVDECARALRHLRDRNENPAPASGNAAPAGENGAPAGENGAPASGNGAPAGGGA
jgi:SAM-dependent methyltransferase